MDKAILFRPMVSLPSRTPEGSRAVVSRRDFLKSAAALLPTLLLGGCGPATKARSMDGGAPVAPTYMINKQDIEDMKAFLEANHLYSYDHESGLERINLSGNLESFTTEVLKNGWDLDLLKNLQANMAKRRLPFLSPRIRFMIRNHANNFLAWIGSECKDLGRGEQMVIALNLQRVTDKAEKAMIADIIFHHEFSHLKDRLFFLGGRALSEHKRYYRRAERHLLQNAIKVKHKSGITSKPEKFSAFYQRLKKIVSKRDDDGKADMPLGHYLVEVRAEEKIPPNIAHKLLLKSEKYHAKRPRSAEDMALDLLTGKMAGNFEFSTAIQGRAAALPLEDKVLFEDLYTLFEIQYEVSRRFIRYADYAIHPK